MSTWTSKKEAEPKVSSTMLDPNYKQSDSGPTTDSTRASSPAPELKDEGKNVDNGSPIEEKANVEAGEEYPEGLRLFSIMFALVVSMFLLSLDMVSVTFLTPEPP
jgi:hypothetical protein